MGIIVQNCKQEFKHQPILHGIKAKVYVATTNHYKIKVTGYMATMSHSICHKRKCILDSSIAKQPSFTLQSLSVGHIKCPALGMEEKSRHNFAPKPVGTLDLTHAQSSTTAFTHSAPTTVPKQSNTIKPTSTKLRPHSHQVSFTKKFLSRKAASVFTITSLTSISSSYQR